MITYDDFAKIELKVARIVEAERVEASDKLIKLLVSLGEETRQIIAGIGKTYAAEDIIDKQIIIVANLEPKQLMGLESQGMLLAASDEDGPVLLCPEFPVTPGSGVK